MQWIDYRQLPPSAGGFSELFFDYLYDFEEVRKFFPSNFRETHAFDGVLDAPASLSSNRATLIEVLREQNTAFGSGQRAMENIALLGNPATLAVVTGQQVGLFGGPLYTVFKTLTAIALAGHLKEKYPDHDVVPVFWIEGEDHDFAEMNHCAVLDAEARHARVEYLPGGAMPERNPGPVGEMVFDSSLEQAFASLAATLPKTEFTEPLIARLRDAYAPGRTFNHCFASWLNILFDGEGLVFLSPNDARLKRILAPLFEREISEFPRTSQLIIAQSAELEQRYHAQIKTRPLNLFLFHKGGRYPIEPREQDFSLRGTRHFISPAELLEIARTTPELLSPNVVLRPIAQDMLLPTAVYVAGPSEIAYHAQLRPVYEHLGVRQPMLYPRASASFVEDRVQRVMERYQLELPVFFDDPEQIKARVIEQIDEVKVDRLFTEADRAVGDALNELRFGLKEIDQTLQGPLDGLRTKFGGSLGQLREKAMAAQQRRHESAMRQIERASGSLLPGGGLQERTLSILYYMNKYGPELVRWLKAEVDIHGFKHQLLTM
jgi:bacillithiol biosynthesis cysteine-adding enzyme BshC